MNSPENGFILNPNPHPPGMGSFRGHKEGGEGRSKGAGREEGGKRKEGGREREGGGREEGRHEGGLR